MRHGFPTAEDVNPSTHHPANGAAEETLDPVRLRRELNEAKEENQLLLNQLHQVQEELERQYLTAKNQVGQHGYPQVQIDSERRARLRAEARCEIMKQTLSWRITAPLRWGLKSLKKRLALNPS
jgi:DNA anti-recombination protein RmuC